VIVSQWARATLCSAGFGAEIVLTAPLAVIALIPHTDALLREIAKRHP
jgi:hypothetical protein